MTPPSSKHILQKGAACSTCKARKVRCDAAKPACTACRRSARFRGDDPNLVLCSYSATRRCGPAPGASPEAAARVKEVKARALSPLHPVAVEAVSSDCAATSARYSEPSFPILSSAPSHLPPSPSTSSSFPCASTSTSTSSLEVIASPSLSPAPRRFVLPAPITSHTASLPLPPYADASPQFAAVAAAAGSASFFRVAAPAGTSFPYYGVDSMTSSKPPSLESTSPSSYWSSEDPHGFVSSPSSVDSFAWADELSPSSSSGTSLTGSPFSLCDDLDYALAAVTSDLPDFAAPPATPSFYSPLDLFATAFGADVKHDSTVDSVFLPSAHDGQATLSLPLFGR
ncbi:hypothetical protein JCM3775_002965 [Rhodotorula graminis]|uniref:Zn(2)-C6 fungal-type domain-containing protein n=1 Tax=Rhodotorula graminis (strain WP1) TaxID=578459 RepID=A0A194S7U9_RHOGW|nr:uncharacterized protein RHOBADRAFT_52642 [Rhodotorula graminis WP1]KPV76667.1 hypothetical protein RHOBADRAFT_52642 [Rhodotorula graminis WP1]